MAILHLPVVRANAILTVPTSGDLPLTGQVGDARVTANDGALYIFDGTNWNPAGGVVSGVVSVNGQTGVVLLDSDDIPEGATNLYVTAANINAALALNSNRFVFTNNSGELTDYAPWQIDPTTLFSNVDSAFSPNNTPDSPVVHNWNIDITPLQNSPDDSIRLHALSINLDAASTGFVYGTNGQAGILLGGGYTYEGNGASFGLLRDINFFGSFGDGVNPGTFQGIVASSHAYSFADNVTINGPVQGYGLNISTQAATIAGTNFNIQVLTDFSQIAGNLYGYQGIALQPNINTIKNNSNFNGSVVGPTLATMEGNAGFYGHTLGGNITNLGTNGYQGFTTNTVIGSVPATANIQGLGIYNQVTTLAATASFQGTEASPVITTNNGRFSGHRAFPQIAAGTGDTTLFEGSMGGVSSTGSVSVLQLNGLTADGRQSGFSAEGVNFNVSGALTALSAQTLQIQHTLFTSFVVPDNTAITGTDALIAILSPDIDFGNAGSSMALGPSGFGINMVAFAGQIHGSGSADLLSALLPAGVFQEDFVLGEWRNINAVSLNGGFTGTVTKASAFHHSLPAGAFATTHYGVYIEPDVAHNWFAGDISVGTQSTPTNASVGIELVSTTKAFRASNMTTAQRTALTALRGMIVYDTDLDQLAYYNGTVWILL